MATLKFYSGAKPGKKRKIAADESGKRKQDYEKNRPERSFNEKWKTNREWLVYDDERKVMRCSDCVEFYGQMGGAKKAKVEADNLKTNTFISGCSNFRLSTLVDHEKTKVHERAHISVVGKKKSSDDLTKTEACQALYKLKTAERARLSTLFRNAHAIAKHNRPLSDYEWLCKIDKAKDIDIGSTYLNEKAASDFIQCVADLELQNTVDIIMRNEFFAFLMDGSTDISGDEQETLYIRSAKRGVITERFLNIGTPNSTRSRDLMDHVMDVFDKNKIDRSKLVAMGSDGASNMTGVRTGLSTLLKDEVHAEIVNVHCLCHRLELAFRDVVKTSKLYDKLMTLLIGIYYFYHKSYKNKQGLKLSIQAMKEGVFPTKVTGTRWLPHLFRGITAFLKTYNALEAHLSTTSHSNPKAGAFLKLMMDNQLMAFILFLQDALDPAIRLSLKLQKPGITLSESLCWVDSTIELLQDKKEKTCDSVNELLATGQYKCIELKGQTPTMKYANEILQGFCDAIKSRFQTESKTVLNATKILNVGSWPLAGSVELKDYGAEEIHQVFEHFQQSLTRAIPEISANAVANEWNMLKKLVKKRYGDGRSLSWSTIFREIADLDQIMLLVDLMLTIPSTSVTCETSFSQLKLLKTCRRSRLGASHLNALMTVKLESPEIADFDPEKSINYWLTGSQTGRRLTYKRQSKADQAASQDSSKEPSTPTTSTSQPSATTEIIIIVEGEKDSITSAEPEILEEGEHEAATEEPSTTIDFQQTDYMSLHDMINTFCDKNDDDDENDEECFDFQSEMINFESLLMFTRE